MAPEVFEQKTTPSKALSGVFKKLCNYEYKFALNKLILYNLY